MKQVYISCSFWDDDWVNELDPSEKLFYLYLITNTNNNLIGIYKMPKKKIRFDTGFSSEVVTLLLDRFENQYKKIYYIDDHIFLKNMVKNQALNSPKLVLGMKNTINSLPEKLKVLFFLEIAKQGYWSVFKGVSIPY
ncbi:MAG TPA: DNA replication protein DnaD, partial [Candidatus Cloacimonadota bacterium]|nr:DNA replication protein DnaD [Candidatus Cloacimonadota bacterium]